MWLEIHDKDGKVDIDQLTESGRQHVIYRAKQLIEELEGVEDDEDDFDPKTNDHE